MKFKPTQPALAEVDLTPLIDIVFQLISFFMMVINFEQTNADERVKLPVDQLAKPATVVRDHQLVLNVGYVRDSEGHIQSEAYVFYNGEKIPVADFSRYLRFESKNFADTGVKVSDVTVVIRGDKDVPTGLIQDLIRQAQSDQVRFEKFALKAMSDPTP